VNRLLAKILVFFSVLISTSICVFAQGSPITTLKVTYHATPGEIVRGQVSVLNKSDTDNTVTVHAKDFLQIWTTVPKQAFLIKAGEKTVIPYAIHIPIKASFQKYYGSIHIQNSNNNLDETAHSIVLTVDNGAQQHNVFQVILAVLAIFVLSIAFFAIGRYCIKL